MWAHIVPDGRLLVPTPQSPWNGGLVVAQFLNGELVAMCMDSTSWWVL